MKKFELLAATAIALFAVSPALAQTAAPDAQTAAPEADEPTDEDIIVTASKRETTLLDTPIAVSVVSGKTIQDAQIRDLLDLQTVVPSLRVSQNQSSANTSFIIRGFGNGANNVGIEPSVGVFIDGVYRSRSAAQIQDLPNLKRVEVLRGPQSTLFGKNASAGVISIVTAEPSFKFGGSAELNYGNYNAFIAKADITGPITDIVAFSLAGNYNRRDGYAFDANLNMDGNERNRYGFRGQLLFQPSADLKFRLIGDYDKIDEVCCTTANIIDRSTTTSSGATVPGYGAVLRAIGGRFDSQAPFSYRSFTNSPSTTNIDNFGVSLQGDLTLGKIGLTSISSYRGVRNATAQDSDFTSADVLGANIGRADIDTYTTEFRATSNFDGRFNFLLGGFYFNENIDTGGSITAGPAFRSFAGGNLSPTLVGSGLASGETVLRGFESQLVAAGVPGVSVGSLYPIGAGIFDNFKQSNDAYSFFGSADFKITDRLIFTGGINFTNDAKRVASNTRSTDAFSALDFFAIGRTVLTNQGIATLVGQALMLPTGTLASAAQIGGFAGAQPAIFAQIQAGALANAIANQAVTPAQAMTDGNPATTSGNPFLDFRAAQFFPPFLNFPNTVENGRTRDNNVSYNLRLAWKATDNLSLYVTYATGFKASSWNLSRDSRPFAADFIPGSPVTNPPASAIRTAGLAVPNLSTGSRFARPEEARVYEGGIKGQFDKIAFNLAVFDQTLTDFQSNIFTGTGFTLINAPSASVFGIEFDGTYRVAAPLTLNFALTYLDPQYNSFPVASAIDPVRLIVVPTNLSGQRIAGISEFSLSGGATYTRELNANLKLLVRGDYQYQSPTQIAEGLPSITREVNSLNMSATLQFKNGLEIAVWGRNITDAQYITAVFPAVGANAGLNGTLSGYPNQPVTYGGSVRIKF